MEVKRVMSYDLMVFEKTKAPNNKIEFMKWYDEQSEWNEDHDYESIEVTSTNLKNWFMDMIKMFPPMNGEFAPEDDAIENDEELERHLTDYCIGSAVIYASFAWSLAEEAYDSMLHFALKHDVGFFDVSGNGDIVLSDGKKLD